MRAKLAAALEEATQQEEETRLATLRLINAAIRDRLAAQGGEGEGDDVEDNDAQAGILDLLEKMIAQRAQSAQDYEEAGRLEMAERERAEIAVIREFMPQPLSSDETRDAVSEVIAEVGAEGIRDITKVMEQLKARYAGRMNFGEVGGLVRDALCRKVDANCTES